MIRFTELQQQIINLRENDKFKPIEIAEEVNCNISYVYAVLKQHRENHLRLTNDDHDGQLLLKAASLQRQVQKQQDVLRVERKIREQIRNENSVAELTEKLIQIFKNRQPNRVIEHEDKLEVFGNSGIIHITDTHFNELVDIICNQYDFYIAAKRLKKLAINAKQIFKSYGITNILIAITGDLVNSDRRLDELLNASTNRANACALGSILLEHFILDLNQDFNITVAYVAGNEGRVNKEMGSSEIMMSDNYDITMMSMLKLMFRNTGVEFVCNSVVENVVNFGNKNILLIHGHQIQQNHMKSMQNIRGKYSDMGIKIDFVLYGHLHATLITDFYSRGSSLVGANAYSNSDLQLSSKASQNIHIINRNDIHSMKIDLQNADNYEGYDIEEDLIAYNAKSVNKIKWMKPKKI